VSESQIFVGLGLTIALAVGCQVLAERFRLPAIVLLLPVGFAAGALTGVLDPTGIVGPAFVPLVELAVAIILFDSGLDLQLTELEGHSGRVVRRLVYLGIPITWAGAALAAGPLLGVSARAAVMLGVILVVSGPTVVAPLLRLVQPTGRLASVLSWESSAIDPIGAILGALVFHALKTGASIHAGLGIVRFAASVGVGAAGALAGTSLWLVLHRRVAGVLGTEVLIAIVVAVAAVCNAIRADTGLIAAILMGVTLANLPRVEPPEDRPFFKTMVQLIIGLLFISISATVTPSSVLTVMWPALALVMWLVLVVRPVVAMLATAGTNLTRNERAFIAWMDPRGIVAASTATAFAPTLARAGIEGAERLLPTTFLVIMGTVTLYGLTAVPVARLLGVAPRDE
jgi:NhaP-type Na+/H+ or K+/H+ antiporter